MILVTLNLVNNYLITYLCLGHTPLNTKRNYDEDFEEDWNPKPSNENLNNSYQNVKEEPDVKEVLNEFIDVPPGFEKNENIPLGSEEENKDVVEDSEIFYSVDEWHEEFNLNDEDSKPIENLESKLLSDPTITKKFPVITCLLF